MKRSYLFRVILSSILVLSTIGLFYLLTVSYGAKSEGSVLNEVSSSAGSESKAFAEELSLSSPSSQSDDGVSCVSVECVDRELKNLLSKEKFSESIDFVVS